MLEYTVCNNKNYKENNKKISLVRLLANPQIKMIDTRKRHQELEMILVGIHSH